MEKDGIALQRGKRNKKLRLVVLISGNGTNLQALIDAIEARELSASIEGVICNRKSAYGLMRATNANIPAVYVPLGPYRGQHRARDLYDNDLGELVKSFKPDLVVLAGWMHILGPNFINKFPQQLINLHPALPGTFPGVNAIEKAWEQSKAMNLSKTGVMVHHVINEIDAGETILTEEVLLNPNESLEELKERMHSVEHQLLVKAINKLSRESE